MLTMLYSTAGLGIAIVNDFKSIEGDRRVSACQHAHRMQSKAVLPYHCTGKTSSRGHFVVQQYAGGCTLWYVM